MRQNEISMILGRNIRHHRHVAGLSQKALGQYLGITYQQLQKYETGINAISCEKMMRLAALFQCSMDVLCRIDPDTIPATGAATSQHYSSRTARLVANFSRIESSALRNQLFQLVQTIANATDAIPQEEP